jgi:LytS/YehU family sensor histidine kinase
MQEDMEKTKLNAELALLKNQISPHFFFNTLNNIYSLIGRNNKDSKNAVIKLSKLMRYILNESGQDNKLLSDEVEFMNNYIDLMKLRIC